MNPKTSQDLFNKIRSQFTNIRIGDDKGGATADPSMATFFEFEFQETYAIKKAETNTLA